MMSLERKIFEISWHASFMKMVKFEPTTPNTSQQGGQTHATCCTQQCCDMLHWHVAIVWPGLNMSQHIATGWPSACNMLRPTMLRYVGLACCDRLAGALEKDDSGEDVELNGHVFLEARSKEELNSSNITVALRICSQTLNFKDI